MSLEALVAWAEEKNEANAKLAEDFDDFLGWLRDWARAYPESVFRPIDMRDVGSGDYAQEEVLSIAARNAAGMARHVLSRVLDRAEKLRDAA